MSPTSCQTAPPRIRAAKYSCRGGVLQGRGCGCTHDRSSCVTMLNDSPLPLAGEGSQVHSTCRVGEPLPRRKPKHDIPVLQESHWIPAFAGMTTVGSQE